MENKNFNGTNRAQTLAFYLQTLNLSAAIELIAKGEWSQ
jgi:hypothetical protein